MQILQLLIKDGNITDAKIVRKSETTFTVEIEIPYAETMLKSEELIQEQISKGLDAMYVGIDAAAPETYQKIRVGGTFSRAVRNVLRYRDLLRQYGNGKQKLFVQFVISDINGHEADDFKTFWKNEGVNVKIRPKVSWPDWLKPKTFMKIPR